MKEIPASSFLKLGTSVRYLIDVQEGTPLAGNEVLSNMRSVLSLVREVDMESTLAAGPYERLQGLYGEFSQAAATNPRLDENQASRLHAIARKVRAGLLAEGKSLTVHYLNDEEQALAVSSSWPSTITLELLVRTPINLWAWFVGILSAAFLGGVSFAQTQAYIEIARFFDVADPVEVIESEHSESAAGELPAQD